MDKRILIKNADGTVGVVIPAEKGRLDILVKEAIIEPERTIPEKKVKLKRKTKIIPLQIIPAKEISPAEYRKETDEEFLTRIAEKDVAEGLEWSIVNFKDIPADRRFRSAWMHKKDKVDIDVDRAKEIHKQRLRELRAPLLENLDLEYQRADESGDDDEKKKIVEKKQKLRDITKVELPDDIHKLKNFIPAILKVL